MRFTRAFTVFAAAFAVVLIGGLALAQVGALRPATFTVSEDGAAPSLTDSADRTEDVRESPEEEPKEEPTEEPKEEPREESTQEPKEEPTEEPKEEPTEEPKEEPTEEPKEEPGDITPPKLEILHPADGEVFHDKTVAFEGVTEPGASVAAGRYHAEVNEDGAWRIVLVLSAGRNTATLTATDAAGNTTSASVVVVYEPEEPLPPTYKFTANQKYGKSTATPPFDVFWGTATPGAKVWIGNDFGSKQVTADAKGNWEARVTFPEAPVGKVIKVVVESSDDGRKVFEFINKGNGEGEHDFTAYQTYGSCGEEVPYDVFYGRASAGERIWVESRYGSGITEADAAGHWEIKVEFAEAPVGKVFEVVIEAKNGGRKVFTFTNTGGVEK